MKKYNIENVLIFRKHLANASVVKSDIPRKENLKCKFTLSFLLILFLGVGQNVFSQCLITTPDNSDDYIDRVTFGSIDNTSGRDATGYGNYTLQSTDMVAGGNETFNVWVYCYGSLANNYTHVFVDWNDDNDFADTDESYYLGATTIDNTNYTTTINCPIGISAGDKIMRVYHAWSTNPSTGCEDITFAEYEEYTISVISCTPPPTIYYSKSSGNLDDYSTWGSNADGTGCNPSNFTTDWVTYKIHDNGLSTSPSGWMVSGTGATVEIGDGSTTIAATAYGNLNIDCDLKILANATLDLNNNNLNLEGDFIRTTSTALFDPGDAGTNTITFDGGTTQSINVTEAGGSTACDADLTFYDVVVSGGTTAKLYYNYTNSRKLNINDITVDSSNTLEFISD